MRSVAEKLAGEVAVVLINTEENPKLAARFGVRGIPVIMLVQNGRAVSEIAGTRQADAIVSWYRNRLKSAS